MYNLLCEKEIIKFRIRVGLLVLWMSYGDEKKCLCGDECKF